jgi:hypothetical protein
MKHIMVLDKVSAGGIKPFWWCQPKNGCSVRLHMGIDDFEIKF